MGMFIFSSAILAFNTVCILVLLYKAIRYKEDRVITVIFSTMLAVALFSYVMAIHTGEFPDIVGRVYFAHVYPVIQQVIAYTYTGSFLLLISSSIAYTFNKYYTPQIAQLNKGVNYTLRIYLSAFTTIISSLLLCGQTL